MGIAGAASWACVVALTGWVVPAGYAETTVDVTVDGITNCTEYAALLQKWKHVNLGTGLATIRLENSNFGASPGSENHLAFVLLDGIDTAYHDHWLFSLNGIGDAVTVRASGAYVGFIDTGASDNHGSSTVSFGTGGTVTIDGRSNCAEISNLTECWIEVPVDCPQASVSLLQSDFGSSPGAYNRMALVLLDGAESASYDYWLFSLNGIGDVAWVDARRAWVGLLDSGEGDNHGTSTVRFDCISATDAITWGEVKRLFR